MGLYKRYAELTIDEVFEIYCDTDRSKYPNQILELKNEIEHRRADGEDPMGRYRDLSTRDIDINRIRELKRFEDLKELPIEFKGTWQEYFRIWIVNLCLTLLSFGIFSAWAKVRRKRYFYSHTTIAGTPFQYLGQPIPILKGRLIAAAGFGIYYMSSHFVTSLFPYVLAAGLVAAPWVLVRSAAFNARYSAFRNMTFHLEAGYWDAVKALYAWGILPILATGLIFEKLGNPYVLGIASVIFGFYFPFLICRIKKFIVEHTSYGGKTGVFSARGRQFYAIYLSSGLIILAFAIPAFMLVSIFSSHTNFRLMTYILLLPTYMGYVLAYAYIRAKTTNLVWDNTSLGPMRFNATLRLKGLAKLYLTNAIGIIASVGFLIPWAVIRTLKYRAEHFRVLQDGELTEFTGSEDQSVAAVGAEALDIFDWDLSL